MIRTAVIPYLRRPVDPATGIGTCCLVRIHDGGRALAEEAIPVGYLDTSGQRPVRVVGEREIAAVVARVRGLVCAFGVQDLAVEYPCGDGEEAKRGQAIGAALLDIGGAFVPATGKGDHESRLRVLMEDESPETEAPRLSSAPTPSNALAPDGGHFAPSHPGPGVAPLNLGHPDPLIRAHPALTGGDPVEPESSAGHTAAQAPKRARRIAGIDPGSKHVAVVVLEGEATPLRHIASLPLTIGRAVPLRTPKTIARKDGTTYTKTERHEVTDDDVDLLLMLVAGFMAEHEVDLAVVETAAFAFKGAGALLLRSNRYGGVIEGALRAVGLPVRSTTSRTWRTSARKMVGGEGGADGQRDDSGRATVGSAATQGHEGQAREPVVDRGHVVAVDLRGRERGGDVGEPRSVDRGAEDRRDGGPPRVTDWRPAVRALVAGLPPDASPHILDAAGCALLAVAPPPEVRPAPTRTRAPRGSGGKPSSTSREANKAAVQRYRERARRAKGCRCTTSEHDPGCPVAAAANEKRSAKMMGNENARRSEV